MKNENAIKHFFFAVANNVLGPTPFYQALLKMVDEYISSLKSVPRTSAYYRYSQWIIMGLLIKTGRGQRNQILEPRVMADDYKDGRSYFTETELRSFAWRRMAFIETLDQIANGKPLYEIEGLDAIIMRANELQPTKFFKLPDKEKAEIEATEYYPWCPEGVVHGGCESDEDALKSDYKELMGITHLGFLSLTLFLEDEGPDHIKKCPYCGTFFFARNTRRQKCTSAKCTNKYHQRDMRSRRANDPVRYCR